MFLILHSLITLSSSTVEDYNTLFTNYREELAQETNYFSGKPQPISERTDLTNELKVYITNTVFERCFYAGNGGAIYYSKSGGKIFIEFSTFSECSAYVWGGAICIFFSDCDCVLYCLCGFKCKTTAADSYCQFILAYIENVERLNFMNSSSVCLSIAQQSDNRFIISMVYGKQICTSVNVSHNKVIQHSAIMFDFSSETSHISYCSINSNTASKFYCILLADQGKEYAIDTCNIINNVGQYTIVCSKQTTIRNCCILNNNISELFGIYNNAHVTIYDSCVEGSLSGITTINVTTDSNQFYLHNLKFTSTAKYCYSGIDKVIKPTPKETPKATLHRRTAKMKYLHRGYREQFF